MLPDIHWIERANRASETRYGITNAEVQLLPPHGSQRRYARILRDGTSEILMLLPDVDSGPAEAGGVQACSVADEPFIPVAHWLQDANVLAPRVLAFDESTRTIWLNDLGTDDLDQALQAGRLTLSHAYKGALNLLADFQAAAQHPSRPAFTNDRALDANLLRWELEHYVEWRFDKRLQVVLSADERASLDEAFDFIVEELTALPQTTIHRDFQSHNIMVQSDGRFALIDFQDALQGPLPYDAVALLRDSYIELEPEMLHGLVAQWAKVTANSPLANGLTEDQLVRSFHIQTIQRKMKDTGRFDLFDIQQGKAGFLQYQPASVRYIKNALSLLSDEVALSGLQDVLSKYEPLFQ